MFLEKSGRGDRRKLCSQGNGFNVKLSNATPPTVNPTDAHVAVEESSALCRVQNKEFGILFAARRTRSTDASDVTFRIITIARVKNFVKREIPILFPVNCERTNLFSVKRDPEPPSATLCGNISVL